MINLNKFLSSLLSKNKNSRRQLQSYIDFANSIVTYSSSKEEMDNGLLHLQKHLSLIIQNKITSQVISNPLHGVPRNAEKFKSILYGLTGKIMDSVDDSDRQSVILTEFPVISFPRDKNRLRDKFRQIGDIVNNPFVEDPQNHRNNTLIYPLNLLLVLNGHHSSTTGMLENNSSLSIDQQIDLSSAFDNYYFDGYKFISKNPRFNNIHPTFPEFGIMYEIGRIIYKHQCGKYCKIKQ